MLANTNPRRKEPNKGHDPKLDIVIPEETVYYSRQAIAEEMYHDNKPFILFGEEVGRKIVNKITDKLISYFYPHIMANAAIRSSVELTLDMSGPFFIGKSDKDCDGFMVIKFDDDLPVRQGVLFLAKEAVDLYFICGYLELRKPIS